MYNIDYFISKFEAIPEENWCVRALSDDKGAHCALGHTMSSLWPSKETNALVGVFKPFWSINCRKNVPEINNGDCPDYQQPTPKQRILAALHDLKTLEEQNNAVSAAQEIANTPLVPEYA